MFRQAEITLVDEADSYLRPAGFLIDKKRHHRQDKDWKI
jgi:hypothetical protein